VEAWLVCYAWLPCRAPFHYAALMPFTKLFFLLYQRIDDTEKVEISLRINDLSLGLVV
jgi:hypothetical protein